MEYEVLKPFNTVTRRIKVGSTIRDTDDISPFTFDDREKREFIKLKTATPPAPVAAVVPPANKMDVGAAVEPVAIVAK